MSRLAFREAVALPRPHSALAMAALASMSLALTGQIAWPALAAAAAAIAWVAREGSHPRHWQRSRILLNLGLVAAVGSAAALWLRGMWAIVALAHFAVLAQALQLLDARPRRSEFLLVALAVFQVVLAANMTDSGLFGPLLVAFTIAVGWTLIVHTLRAEALEAGKPEAARRVLGRGLRRTVVLASLASVLLAALLFPVLPRIRSGALLSRGPVTPAQHSGFSDRVELGAIGKIRQDTHLVLRVETLSGDPAPGGERYWRGVALDHFDGRRWSVTPPGLNPVRGDAVLGLRLTRTPGPGQPRGKSSGPSRLVQRIIRERIEGGVLFSASRPLRLAGGAIGRLERDADGSFFSPTSATQRLEYVVTTRPQRRNTLDLVRDRALPPAPRGARFLQMPPLDKRIAALARRMTAGATSDAARAEQIESWLRQHGRYTDELPAYGADGRSPVEEFLLHGIAGHCEYFASSMVMLARSVGLPARVVNGFAGGEVNRLGGFVEVRQSDAHSWVEVHYANAGWVPYDPTPPDLRRAGAQAHHGSSVTEAWDAVELWWFRNVVDFDRGDQLRTLKRLWLAWHSWRTHVESPGMATLPHSAAHPPHPLPHVEGRIWILAGVALLALLVVIRGSWRRHSAAGAPDYYLRALRLLARRGHRREASTTARGFAVRVAPALPEHAAAAFGQLTECYLRERFSGEQSAGALEELARLRDSLRR